LAPGKQKKKILHTRLGPLHGSAFTFQQSEPVRVEDN